MVRTEKISLPGQTGDLPAFVFTPPGTVERTSVILPGAAYSFRAPLLHYPLQWLLQKGHRVIALDKIYGEDPNWSGLGSEQEARKAVEDDASFLFPALANRYGFEPDLILARSLGTYSLASALEKKLIRPKKIVWQTPALRSKWNMIHDCDIPGFAVIGTADPRYAEGLSYLPRDRFVVVGADHGMEFPGEAVRSIEILAKITQATIDWIAKKESTGR